MYNKIEDQASSIVSNDQLSYIPILVLIAVLIFALLIFEALAKKFEGWINIKYWILVLFPFLLMIIILIPLIATNVDIFIIFLVSGIPFVIAMAFSFIVMRKKMKQTINKNKNTIDKYHNKKKN